MRLSSILLLMLAGLLPLVQAETFYTVVDLGPSGLSAGAYGIAAGGVAAGWRDTGSGPTQGFIVTQAGVQMLGGLQSGYDVQVYGVNAQGDAAGLAYTSQGNQAVLWHNGALQSLGEGAATAINQNGKATGGLTTASGQSHAFAGSSDGIRDLGVLPGGTWSSGFGLNDAGQVAGYGDTGATFHAFRWDPVAGLRDLGTLGGLNSYGMGLSDTGIVIGHSETASGATHAFRWVNGQMLDLGTLDGGSSYAYGINSSGVVVGYGTDGVLGQTAFVYRSGQIRDLNSLLTGASPYYLTAAYAINDEGQIAGSALENGIEHAIRLDPVVVARSEEILPAPEPSTWQLLAVGALLLSRQFRRRRRA